MTGAAVAPKTLPRELGVWDCGRPGPTLLVLAGVHGNEPAGVRAVQQVLAALQEAELPIAGRLVALAGNLPALAAGRRFVGRDLNRGWSAWALAELQERAAASGAVVTREATGACPEDRQQLELLERFEQAVHRASGPVVFVDLHTSSADGPPFLCLADTIDNRRLGLATGVPILLGIEETIDGASLEWWSERGIAALAVEGGRHEHPATVDNLQAVLWLLLVRLGLLRPGSVDLAPHRAQLRAAAAGADPMVEIVHRHAIAPDDAFSMEPGFVNFQRVRKGQLLARDRNGSILAPYDCCVMLPLYQALGDDGFFLARPVGRLRRLATNCLRRLRLDALLHWLPGVRRDPDDPLTILVEPWLLRWLPRGLPALLGFRKWRRRGDRLAFTARWSRTENRRL
jgi:succinylglutamate desuccinylase